MSILEGALLWVASYLIGEVRRRCTLDTAGVGGTMSQCWMMVLQDGDDGTCFTMVRADVIDVDFDSAFVGMRVEVWSGKLVTFTPPT